MRHYKPSCPQYTKKRACFNCNSESHLVRDCPHPVSFSRAASSRIRELKGNRERNAAHIVLAHLCQELDSKTMNDVGENSSDEDAEIFESMLLSEHCNDKDMNTIHVMTVSSPNFRHSNDVFSGACLDSGAQRTVIGQLQANAYMKIVGNEYETVQRCMSKMFRFGTSVHESVSVIKIWLPLGDDHFVKIFAHIIPIDVPLLIGLDIMKYLKIIINFADSTLQSSDGKWKAPLVFKYGHMYLEWPSDILYTENELKRIHRHFYHPSTEKLWAVIRRANNNELEPEVFNTLKRIRNTCDTCQRNGDKPHRFRVAIPEGDCIFN